MTNPLSTFWDLAWSTPTIRPLRDPGSHVFAVGDQIVERYRIVRFLGQGGLGQVYEALDLKRGRPVALKTVRPEIASRRSIRRRFHHEAHLLRRIEHPNVCRFLELVEQPVDRGDPLICLVMELLTGVSLARHLADWGPLSTLEALPILRALAEGLAASHRAGVVHGDLKTDNVMLTEESGDASRTVVTDFGFAVLSGVDVEPIGGTPGYMAPEQYAGQPATPASDVWAFAQVARELLTGYRPSRDRPDERTPPRLPILPPAWKEALAHCLAWQPSDRYRDAGELCAALDNATVRTRRRRTWQLAAALLVGLLGVVLWTVL